MSHQVGGQVKDIGIIVLRVTGIFEFRGSYSSNSRDYFFVVLVNMSTKYLYIVSHTGYLACCKLSKKFTCVLVRSCIIYFFKKDHRMCIKFCYKNVIKCAMF